MIDVLLLIVLGVVTWCVAAEGFVGAAQICLIVILSGLLAMNFFEPLANVLQSAMSGAMANWADVIALVGLFTVFVFVLRFLTEKTAPGFPDANKLVYEGIRWFSAALAGYVTMAFLLTAIHTVPLPREFIGFTPERANFFGVTAPDRQWLGFTQYVSERPFRQGTRRIFDGSYAQLGDPSDPYTNEIWASFPIRYATRRELLNTASTPRPTSREDIQNRLRPGIDAPSDNTNNNRTPSTGF